MILVGSTDEQDGLDPTTLPSGKKSYLKLATWPSVKAIDPPSDIKSNRFEHGPTRATDTVVPAYDTRRTRHSPYGFTAVWSSVIDTLYGSGRIGWIVVLTQTAAVNELKSTALSEQLGVDDPSISSAYSNE